MSLHEYLYTADVLTSDVEISNGALNYSRIMTLIPSNYYWEWWLNPCLGLEKTLKQWKTLNGFKLIRLKYPLLMMKMSGGVYIVIINWNITFKPIKQVQIKTAGIQHLLLNLRSSTATSETVTYEEVPKVWQAPLFLPRYVWMYSIRSRSRWNTLWHSACVNRYVTAARVGSPAWFVCGSKKT